MNGCGSLPRCPQRPVFLSISCSLLDKMILRLPSDMDMALDQIVPESLDWQHTDEGPE